MVSDLLLVIHIRPTLSFRKQKARSVRKNENECLCRFCAFWLIGRDPLDTVAGGAKSKMGPGDITA